MAQQYDEISDRLAEFIAAPAHVLCGHGGV